MLLRWLGRLAALGLLRGAGVEEMRYLLEISSASFCFASSCVPSPFIIVTIWSRLVLTAGITSATVRSTTTLFTRR